MKKQIILTTLLAASFSGMSLYASGNWAWSINFGTEYENFYSAQGDLEIDKASINQYTGAQIGGAIAASNKRPSFTGNFGDWSDDFVFTVNLTLGEKIYASSYAKTLFAEIGGTATNATTGEVSDIKLSFGPDSENANRVSLYGDIQTNSSGIIAVTPNQYYAFSLTKIGNAVSITVNGVETASGTLVGNFSGTISKFALGGDLNTQYRTNGLIHSVSMHSIPEPSIFGLLAGLGTLTFVVSRRRRK